MDKGTHRNFRFFRRNGREVRQNAAGIEVFELPGRNGTGAPGGVGCVASGPLVTAAAGGRGGTARPASGGPAGSLAVGPLRRGRGTPPIPPCGPGGVPTGRRKCDPRNHFFLLRTRPRLSHVRQESDRRALVEARQCPKGSTHGRTPWNPLVSPPAYLSGWWETSPPRRFRRPLRMCIIVDGATGGGALCGPWRPVSSLPPVGLWTDPETPVLGPFL